MLRWFMSPDLAQIYAEKMSTRATKAGDDAAEGNVLESNFLLLPNAFGITALEAAYNHGEEWLEQLMDYQNCKSTRMAMSYF